MAMTTYLKNKTLDNLFRGESYTSPSIIYVALSKSAPASNGSNCTEPDAASYKRLAISSNSVNWNAANGGSISNSSTLRFSEAEESWTTQAAPITHWAMFDQETGGNMLFYGQLTKTQEVPRGAILEFPENGMTTTILDN